MNIKLDVGSVMAQEVNLELKRLDVGHVMAKVLLSLKLVLRSYMNYVMIAKEQARI